MEQIWREVRIGRPVTVAEWKGSNNWVRTFGVKPPAPGKPYNLAAKLLQLRVGQVWPINPNDFTSNTVRRCASFLGKRTRMAYSVSFLKGDRYIFVTRRY